MNNPSYLNEQVKLERLYTHVLKLEGERHPITNPDGLQQAKDYILSELESYGASVEIHTFSVDGYPDPFYNIEGLLGDPDQPTAAIMSHYDTFFGTTGANDNAAAVAISLEVARILAQEDSPPPVRFLSFTLEEENPAFQLRLFKAERELGLIDEHRRYASVMISKILQEHDRMARARWRIGQSMGEVHAQITEELAGRLTPQLKEYLDLQAEVYREVRFLPGTFGHLGSWAWMNDAIAKGKKLKYGICMDEVGRTYQGEGHQVLPPEFPLQLAQLYRVNPEKISADWAFLLTNGSAALVGEVFCEQCRLAGIDLPYLHLHIPMDFSAIKENFPQTLGSDYSAFWRENIPALALFDTAGWRAPYYGHTYADTIEKLDFDQIARITKATLATLLDPRLS